MSSLIPFDKTIYNLNKLDIGDYMDMIAYDQGLFYGCMKSIHINAKYPEFHNLIYNPNTKCILVYTKNGWKKRSEKYLIDQIKKEEIECFKYIQQNAHLMAGIIKGLQEVEKIEHTYLDS